MLEIRLLTAKRTFTVILDSSQIHNDHLNYESNE